jgi:hypothetical protein
MCGARRAATGGASSGASDAPALSNPTFTPALCNGDGTENSTQRVEVLVSSRGNRSILVDHVFHALITATLIVRRCRFLALRDDSWRRAALNQL